MRTKLTRWLLVALTAVGVAAAVVSAMLGLPYGRGNPEAFAHVYTFPGNGNTTHLHIDADADNGWRPCDPIDETATVEAGATHRVAVCIEDYAPNSVNNFLLHIRYTGDPDATPPTTINTAPTVACGAGTADPYCLDANPDANDGTGADKLGTWWDCSPALGSPPPVGEYTGTPHVADAFIWCTASIASPDQELADDPGLLATITFTATGTGMDTIDFGPIDENNTNYVAHPRPDGGDARCGTRVPADQAGCFGATITKVCADKQIGNGTGIPGEDGTAPDSAAGLEGDACGSADVDNDGVPNGSDPDPGGDITYDDNNNGIACVAMGTDAADDGPSWDANCNGVLDGEEGICPLAVNPNGDNDGDGLLNTWEVCKWGTDPNVVDSDGDGTGDCIEAVDTDGNKIIDFGGDALNSARAALLPAGIGPGQFGKDGDFDLDGSGIIDFGKDTLTTARMAFGILPCQ